MAARPTKRALLLQTARSLFLEQGFVRTSADAIFAAAGVSNPTFYAHFPTKQALLEAIVQAQVLEAPSSLAFLLTGDFDHDLKAVIRFLLQLALSPDTLAWDRIMAGEARRLPTLGTLFFDAGPRHLLSLLRDFLQQGVQAGHLHLSDPAQAADFIFGWTLGIPLFEAQLTGRLPRPDDIEARAAEIAQRFRRAYSRPPQESA
jgi:TetR/AcrR family transcriptional repressor of mexJK operon